MVAESRERKLECVTTAGERTYLKVEMYNFVGKDNVPFHAIIFPATLLGTQQPYNIVNHLCATEYLNYEDTKFRCIFALLLPFSRVLRFRE